MADDKLREAALKPIATIKKPVIAAEKKEETKAATEEKKETKTAAKKPAAKKTAAKATTAKKAAPAKTATKAASVKEEDVKSTIVLQYADKEVTYSTFVDRAKEVFQNDLGGKVSDIKSLDLYVKPEESMVYFVINGEINGQFNI